MNTPLIEPLLVCRYPLPCGRHCDRRYRERKAHRAGQGRWKGRLIAPHCCHPLSAAVYIDPQTGQELRPYAAG